MDPSSVVVLGRSVGYGAGVAAVMGAITAAVQQPEPSAALAIWALGALVASVFGAFIGFVLGLSLIPIDPSAGSRSKKLRAFIAIGCMVCVAATVWFITGEAPMTIFALLFIVPAGIAAWFLLPVVLRPEPRDEMPRLPGQST